MRVRFAAVATVTPDATIRRGRSRSLPVTRAAERRAVVRATMRTAGRRPGRAKMQRSGLDIANCDTRRLIPIRQPDIVAPDTAIGRAGLVGGAMPDWSDAIAQGILCKRCILPLEDDLAPGPRLCHDCREEDRLAKELHESVDSD